MIKDGWHKLGACEVYTEAGAIVKATKLDYNGYDVPAAVYVVNNRLGGLDKVDLANYNTVRTGIKAGRYYIK